MLFKFIDLLNGQIADGLLCQHPEEVSAIRGIPMAHGAFHHLHLSLVLFRELLGCCGQCFR